MPLFPVTVTASYDAGSGSGETVERLRAWEASGDGRTFVVDDSIAPVRWTATVDYQVEPADAAAAERAAVARFAEDPALRGVEPPETIVAATGPLA